MVAVPQHLRALYLQTDGFVTPQGQVVYSVEDLCERNRTYEVPTYCPTYILIGDDSGGRGYLLSLDSADLKVYSSSLGDMGPEDFEVESASLAHWIGQLK